MAEMLLWMETHNGLASWVQALGSIATIAFAYWLGERQASKALENAQKLESSKERARLESVLGIARLASRRAEAVKSLYSNSPLDLPRVQEHYRASNLTSVASALSAVPVHELGSAKAATSILDMRDQLLVITRTVTRWEEGCVEAGFPGTGDRIAFDRATGDRIRQLVGVIDARLKSLEEVLAPPF